ncbi:MAG: FkbM family methyltransferase [Sulfuricurvum sp.]
MQFISYAQNFEDVILWRALGHIQTGFYVDVGAYSPDIDSVTKAFYERGWSGINIEPNPDFQTQYLSKRERDINLDVAISNIEGESEIYLTGNLGLSSLDKSIVDNHKTLGFASYSRKISVTTLTKICHEYAYAREIHFLKVDVEGLEKNVLLGNDWNRFRPWIVVVEATQPLTQIENHEEWEYILLDNNYEFVYSDGLNRFYVSQEHSDLIDSFKYPPNVFDHFIQFSHFEALQQAAKITYAIEFEHKIKSLMAWKILNFFRQNIIKLFK